jgi:hypothetical protein
MAGSDHPLGCQLFVRHVEITKPWWTECRRIQIRRGTTLAGTETRILTQLCESFPNSKAGLI